MTWKLAIDILILIYGIGLIILFVPSVFDWNRPPPIPALWWQRRAVWKLLKELGNPSACEIGHGCYPILLRKSGVTSGVELSGLAWFTAKVFAVLTFSKMKLLKGDAYKVQAKAEAYVLYLGKEMTNEYVKTLSPGTHVISVGFPVTDFTPVKVEKTVMGPVYLYKIV